MYSTVRTDPVLEEYNTIEPEPAEGTEEWHLKYGYGNSPKPQESAAPVVEQRELNPREKILQAYQRLIETQEKPKFDTESQEYLQRAAKYNAIGKGLSNLAEIFSLAKGGNVPAPEKDGKIQSYIGKYFQNIDDYRDKVDRYNIMNNQNQMRFHEMLYLMPLMPRQKRKNRAGTMTTLPTGTRRMKRKKPGGRNSLKPTRKIWPPTTNVNKTRLTGRKKVHTFSMD